MRDLRKNRLLNGEGGSQTALFSEYFFDLSLFFLFFLDGGGRGGMPKDIKNLSKTLIIEQKS